MNTLGAIANLKGSTLTYQEPKKLSVGQMNIYTEVGVLYVESC